ncbi:MAG: hypothetical protein H6709_21345 [Kofleriaceae bacterium]|nr:hypothetical protein [Kofleriaceae bacterium]
MAAGDRDTALRRLRALAKLTCPFPAPADTQAVPILIAFTEGLEPGHAAASLKTLARLRARTTGATRRLLASSVRVVALTAAERAYRDGKLGDARKLVAQAKGAASRVAADELALDLAALDIVDGKLDVAAAALEKLAPKLPEALIHLGVIDDRRGDGASALARWRQARRAGARFPLLGAWIDGKELVFGRVGDP